MSSRIPDYGLLGNTRTAALVSRHGSLDWLCLPRFDAGACFAALLGTPEHGRWLLTAKHPGARVRRRYRPETLILETDYETPDGAVTVTDCMPVGDDAMDVVRVVCGRHGTVAMQMELTIRFDYGSIVPWVRRRDHTLLAVAGPDALELHTEVPLRGENFRTVAEFTAHAGERIPFTLRWYPSHRPAPAPGDAGQAIDDTERFWRAWTARSTCACESQWREPLERSLLTLKALTDASTGGIVAAPTTSLPEEFGGARNWDYRYCWLRDATFTLYALLINGYHDEARAWREWLLRAAAGRPADLQIVYGLAGERRLPECELPWLPGYEGSGPVRIGNAASQQFQLDVYGEVMDVFHVARRGGIEVDGNTWALQQVVLDFLESNWERPDEGIWEVRGPRRHFTYSKVMAWVAFDRAVKAVERFKCEGPVERWRALRDRVRTEVLERGVDHRRGTFVQAYGSTALDGSLLLLPLVGFIPATDPRMRATLAAIEQELTVEGFVRRYRPAEELDGLPAGEGTFLACSFWLVDNLILQGRVDEARHRFERLLAVRSDLGLLAEEYDPRTDRQLGNFPQALSHIALVNTAVNLSRLEAPCHQRGEHAKAACAPCAPADQSPP
ncbi:MAG: glycoside hydrolase family 15 protein [Candidatus Binatia bacterium]